MIEIIIGNNPPMSIPYRFLFQRKYNSVYPNLFSIDIRSHDSLKLSSHWIVVTTVAPPTADIMYMAALPGWKVVVVGDEKTRQNWRYLQTDTLHNNFV
ncbi:conserved uncharacterized protein [Plakobranchus ocellatus]|uniref:Conserved uncharacterized protein n=1 Tax=Plakobranchus ocellatus TaxID=259542 RepID=A0AAV4A2W8_9GAST|nr:conserved uncharacterized protein [Plakobranchus ocellatus]